MFSVKYKNVYFILFILIIISILIFFLKKKQKKNYLEKFSDNSLSDFNIKINSLIPFEKKLIFEF